MIDRIEKLAEKMEQQNHKSEAQALKDLVEAPCQCGHNESAPCQCGHDHEQLQISEGQPQIPEGLMQKIMEIADKLDQQGLLDDADQLMVVVVEAAKGKKKNWIPKKLKKGRFTEWCKRHGFDGPSKSCAAKAMQSDDASVRGMASFYSNVAASAQRTYTIAEVEKLCPACAADMREQGLDEIILED